MRRPWRAASVTTPLLIGSNCLLTACGVDVAGAREGGVPHSDRVALVTAAAARPASSDGGPQSVTLEGDDFTLRYPGDATVRPLDAESAPGAVSAVEIRGPALRDVEGDPIVGSASYSFEVVSYDNTERLPLDAWVARQRGREATHDVVAVADTGHEDDAAPTRTAVGGLPALRESRFGGDCDLVRYYVARGTRVVAFRYADFPVESDSLNPENVRTYARVMSTFRWKGSATGA